MPGADGAIAAGCNSVPRDGLTFAALADDIATAPAIEVLLAKPINAPGDVVAAAAQLAS